MKVIYTYKEGTTPVFVTGGAGVQRVLVTFKDNGNFYVYFCDDYLRNTYLNRIISITVDDIYSNSNFERIQSDEEFYYYVSQIEKLYNYNSIHKGEEISGHDQGGAVLVGLDGKPLL